MNPLRISSLTSIAAAIAMLAITGCDNTESPTSTGTGAPFAKPTNATQTAQSIGVALTDLPDNLIITETTEWSLDEACVLGYFTMTTSGSPNAGQINVAKGRLISSVGTDPRDMRCLFFNGGDLETQVITVASGKTVTFTPNTESVEAHTCWSSETLSEGGEAEITISADIAGESVISKSSGPWTKKYSFSLLTVVDDVEVSRVQNVFYTLQSWNGSSWDDVDSYEVGTVSDVEEGTFSTMYDGNAGTFGTTSLLVTGATQGDILDGVASNDNHSGNNSSNSPSSDGNAAVAHGPEWTFGLSDAGTYRVVITGTVKGNTTDGVTTSDVSFSYTSEETFVGHPCD